MFDDADDYPLCLLGVSNETVHVTNKAAVIHGKDQIPKLRFVGENVIVDLRDDLFLTAFSAAELDLDSQICF